MSSLRDMTWRRFQVLLRCLSPQSATLTRMQSKQYIGSGRKGEAVKTIEDPKAAEAAFMAAFATPKGKRGRKRRPAKSEVPTPAS